MPAAPLAGIGTGIFSPPPVGANVWVEFEEGNVRRPIWSGAFWEPETAPPLALAPPLPVPHILLQTPAQNAIHICDGPAPPLTAGGIVLRSGPSTLVIGPEGVKIIAPKIEITGLTVINNGALMVTL
jgi:hypothetical protein